MVRQLGVVTFNAQEQHEAGAGGVGTLQLLHPLRRECGVEQGGVDGGHVDVGKDGVDRHVAAVLEVQTGDLTIAGCDLLDWRVYVILTPSSTARRCMASAMA